MSGKKENGGKDARLEMTEAVWRNVLDPILTFAELMRGYHTLEDESRVDLDLEEISVVLILLVIGGYTETKLCCKGWDKLTHTCGDTLEKEISDWKE